MSRKQRIQDLLNQHLQPSFLDIHNESHKHHVPEGSETHFKIIAVASQFLTLSRLERHRLIHHILIPEFNNGLHALSLNLYTPEEWEKAEVSKSPSCRDGFNK